MIHKNVYRRQRRRIDLGILHRKMSCNPNQCRLTPSPLRNWIGLAHRILRRDRCSVTLACTESVAKLWGTWVFSSNLGGRVGFKQVLKPPSTTPIRLETRNWLWKRVDLAEQPWLWIPIVRINKIQMEIWEIQKRKTNKNWRTDKANRSNSSRILRITKIQLQIDAELAITTATATTKWY